jgi:hypothetical protein
MIGNAFDGDRTRSNVFSILTTGKGVINPKDPMAIGIIGGTELSVPSIEHAQRTVPSPPTVTIKSR